MLLPVLDGSFSIAFATVNHVGIQNRIFNDLARWISSKLKYVNVCTEAAVIADKMFAILLRVATGSRYK